AAIETGAFQLTATPTGMGYASRMPDVTFRVFGLTDASLNHWSRSTLDWANAPASIDDTNTTIDPDQVRSLGTFQMLQGQQRGVFAIDTPELVTFLQNAPGDFVTLIVVSETQESKGGALVHGFASRRHATLAPPTLRLWMKE
ncbi:MAG: hypothetical protein ACYTGQ_19865, partial [Planctomycetota bacterium]